MYQIDAESLFYYLKEEIKEGRSRITIDEIITTKTPTPITTPTPWADGRGSEAHTFRRLALAVMFFCTVNKDRSTLIRCSSFFVSFDLIGIDPMAEQGHLHSKNQRIGGDTLCS